MPTTQTSTDAIAKKIKAARKQRRLSLRELALLSGVPFFTIHRAEKGEEIAASSMFAICKTLKIRP